MIWYILDPSENTGTPTVNGDKKSGKNKGTYFTIKFYKESVKF